MPRGGSRPNAGRKTGSLTKKSQDAAVALSIDGDNPLDFLLNVMRRADAPFDARFEAAKAAAPYMHARLQAVEMKAEVDASIEVSTIELVAPSFASDDHAAH